MSIGNLPKELRRKPSRHGYVLLGYLPTDKLDHIKTKAGRRRATANLFHACMKSILRPLKVAGVDGVEMTSGDGKVRQCHPILAVYVGDYPEQNLVGLTKKGDCPVGTTTLNNLGNPDDICTFRDLQEVFAALDKAKDGPTAFTKACKNANIRPTQDPFWKDLPFLNIYQSIVPDILHQLYQGVVKHLLEWLKDAYGAAEIDARCRRLPPNHGIRVFLNGISNLSRVTGTEHDQICRFILGIIVGARLPENRSPTRLITAVRSILEFLFIAQFPVHTDSSLIDLENSLDTFHESKGIFVDLGIRLDFNFPKLHFCGHYRQFIELYGTTDNYNTQYTERLHIDLAKEAYRATNRKDEFSQMTVWLERREKIVRHEKYIRRRLNSTTTSSIKLQKPWSKFPLQLRMAKSPSAYGVKFDVLSRDFGASDFSFECARFAARNSIRPGDPLPTRTQLEKIAASKDLPFQKVSVFYRIKWEQLSPCADTTSFDIIDSVHVQPSRIAKGGKAIVGQFDTVLVNMGNGAKLGIEGYRIAQVRCVFELPGASVPFFFPHSKPPASHFAYVEWFTDFAQPVPPHNLYKVSREKRRDGSRACGIVPVTNIIRSVHLYPFFGVYAPADWKSSMVLEQCSSFFVNPCLDKMRDNLYTPFRCIPM